MLQIVKEIVKNVLTALYQPFNFAFVMSVLIMFLYMFAKECGWRKLMKQWTDSFKNSIHFRRLFLLVFCTVMILFKTLLNRSMWANPVSNVIGVWGLYNEKGEFTTEMIENIILFIPFTILLLWCYHDYFIEQPIKLRKILWKSTMIVFVFSLSIEFLQLFLRLGTFQLSDLFDNTLGGALGGFIYWCGYKILHKKG